MTTVADGLYQYGGMSVTPGVPVPWTGRYFWVDPVNGADGNSGRSPTRAFATLYKLHSMMRSGKNDVGFLIGDGANTGTARLSKALAQSVDPTATTGVLTWSKNACHLVGIAAPNSNFQRARIAPPATYTAATFGSGNFMVVSGNGCYFANFSMFHGFTTGTTSQICLTVTGSRNCFTNINIGGLGDAESAADTASTSLLVGAAGSGENDFINCTIGIDTVLRTAANASLTFAGRSPRNRFVNCWFPFWCNTGGVLGITSAAAGMDRINLFERCVFANAIGSGAPGGTTMTALVTLPLSTGGILVMKDCCTVGITDLFTNAATSGQMWIEGGTPTAATTGLAVAPA